MNRENILFIDTENSGLDPGRNQILQFSYIVYDPQSNKILDKDTHFVRHESIILDMMALQVNKLNLLDMFKEGAIYNEKLNEFFDVLIKSYNIKFIAGWNVSFDYDFIRPYLPYFVRKLDIMPLFYLTKVRDYKLQTVAKMHGITHEAHNCESDVMVTFELFKIIRSLYGYK